MQANSVNFLRDILNNGRYFYIPVYQRNYSWQDEQCKQLIKDVMKIYEGQYNDHFIGTVVWKADDGNTDKLSVIDGQQRLTTMFLLILAMRHNSDNEVLNEELDRIIYNKFTQSNRLTPIKSDNEVFEYIVKNQISNVTKKSNRIYANYSYFNEYIQKHDLDIYKLYQSIEKLSAIKMELHQFDNPQIIFESINSTGMSLSIADLIRNFLLMNESYDTQTELFERYWYQFESKLGVDKLIAFFEHYLNIHITEKSINRNNMYTYFKKYFMDNNFTAETLLQHLEPYVEVYALLCNDNNHIVLSDNKLTSKINHVRDSIIKLEVTTPYMFLMPTMIDHKNWKLNDEELLYSFELVLSYVFRRGVVGLGTNVLQGTFRRLYRQVIENVENHGWQNAVDYALVTSKMNSTAYFPSDQVFFDSLHSRNLYGKFKYTDYLLLSIENHGNKSKLDEEQLSIEHVMPQTLTAAWRNVLGDNWKELHEENVNDLGNLTLTSYNSELSNQEYSTKKAIIAEERHIKLNDYFLNVDEWNDKEIQKRGRVVANEALAIWKYPSIDSSVSKQVLEDRYNQVSITELATDYFSIKPAKLILEEQEYSVNSIRDTFDAIVNLCIERDTDLFERSFCDNQSRKSGGNEYFIFSRDENAVYDPRELKNGIYYDKNRSGNSLFALMFDILTIYNINTDDVIVKYYK